MSLKAPADPYQGYYLPLHQRQSRWRVFTASPRPTPSRHRFHQMAPNSAVSPEIHLLEQMRQADGAGPAHAEALAEDAIIWASLNGLVHLFYEH